MTDTPTPDLTAPEQVERLALTHDQYQWPAEGDAVYSYPMRPATHIRTAATLRALSAKLKAAEAERDAALGAMNALLHAPKGVVPREAEPFYRGALQGFTAREKGGE